MSGADEVLDAIDTALGDHTVGPDAMRWTPDGPGRRPTGLDNPEVRRAIARFAATVIREMFRKPRKSDYTLVR